MTVKIAPKPEAIITRSIEIQMEESEQLASLIEVQVRMNRRKAKLKKENEKAYLAYKEAKDNWDAIPKKDRYLKDLKKSYDELLPLVERLLPDPPPVGEKHVVYCHTGGRASRSTSIKYSPITVAVS